MIDFLILYQHRAREMDNICLIRVELERRGYTVDFRYIWDPWSLKYNLYKRPKVVVTSALYDNRDYINFVCWNGGINSKVVNLQWEQVFSIMNYDSLKRRKREETYKATFVSWGKCNYNWLIQNSEVKNTVITGPVQFDFLRKELLPFFKAKNEIQDELKLDTTKKIILYISSFAVCTYTDEEVQATKEMFSSDVEVFFEESMQSKIHTLKWIRQLLADRSDILFIYRPHPAERDDMKLLDMQQEFANFRVVRDYSVKQWILIADKIFTWFSTSIADVFFADKNCGIIRPIPLSEQVELPFCQNAEMITTYEQIIYFIDSNDLPFPIPTEDIYCHYDVQETPSYVRVCDLLEKVHSTNEYDMDISIPWKRPSLWGNFKSRLAYFLVRHNKSYTLGVQRRGFWGWVDTLCSKREYYLKDYFSETEARLTMKRIRDILSK